MNGTEFHSRPRLCACSTRGRIITSAGLIFTPLLTVIHALQMHPQGRCCKYVPHLVSKRGLPQIWLVFLFSPVPPQPGHALSGWELSDWESNHLEVKRRTACRSKLWVKLFRDASRLLSLVLFKFTFGSVETELFIDLKTRRDLWRLLYADCERFVETIAHWWCPKLASENKNRPSAPTQRNNRDKTAR